MDPQLSLVRVASAAGEGAAAADRRRIGQRGRRRSLARATWLAVAALAISCSASACGGSSPSASTVLSRYLSAWGHGDWAAMRSQVLDPPAAFTTVNSQLFRALRISRASFAALGITVARSGKSASARVAEHFTLPHVGRWSPVTTVHMVKRDGNWHVTWSPATVNPSLRAGEKLAVREIWPTRAPIRGAGGAALTSDRPEVVVGVVGGRIHKANQVRADLLAAGAVGAEVSRALTLAAAHPTEFQPVFTVSLARFEQLKSEPGPQNVYSVPGTAFERTTASGAITSQLAAHVVGTLGPITAQELKTLGSPYNDTSVVGQSGLQASQERTLAGDPSTHIDVEDAAGDPVKLLASFGGHPGSAVRTSIDPRVQRAAEAALAHSTRPGVSMVVIRASTSQVLAVVSDPPSTYDTALTGAYPPGSTFKVLTFTALFAHGLTPSSPTSCPPTLTVDGEAFHNAAGVGPASRIDSAFTESCNTAFIGLATTHLSSGDYPEAARLYGLNRTPQLGLPAFSANVPAPKSRTELAADAIGQGRVTFSPLGMAQVAAAIDSGTVRAPRLVQGAPDDTLPPSRLPAGLVSDLRTMMAEVATSGTAAGTGLPAGAHVKTGTAEYGVGAESKLKIDGWLMGYDGDIAFAIVTQNTGGADGGPVDGPLIADFLGALGPGA
jgi:cell division protein FtsI/penicillin-binding protein 2